MRIIQLVSRLPPEALGKTETYTACTGQDWSRETFRSFILFDVLRTSRQLLN